MEAITKSDLRELRDDVQEAIRQMLSNQAEFRQECRIGFEDIKDRQDRTNGRIDKIEQREFERETLLRDHGQTMAGIVATIKSITENGTKMLKGDDSKPGISARDVKVATFMLAAGGALIEYGPRLVKALIAMGATP